jgi:hypothetical protein
MTRDKLLTVRIEENKREAFNNWCEARDYSYSRFLYEVIEACLSGRIDESILSSEPVDNQSNSKLLEQIEKVDKSIDERIEKRLAVSIDNELDIDTRIDEKLKAAIANLKLELAPILDAERKLSDLLEKHEA